MKVVISIVHLQIMLSLLPWHSYHTVIIIAGYMMEGYFHTSALKEYYWHTSALSSFTKDQNRATPYHIKATAIDKGCFP
jgi:hypothetical protein